MRILLFIFALFFATSGFGQKVDSLARTNETQINMTGLLTQLIPFGNATNLSGPFGLTWLNGRNNKYFRLSIGARILPENEEFGFFTNNTRLTMAIGYTHRVGLGKRFFIDRSYLAMGYVGGFNTPGGNTFRESKAIGLGFGFAPGYNITSQVKLSMETILFLGNGENGFNFIITPPVGINLAVAFSKS